MDRTVIRERLITAAARLKASRAARQSGLLMVYAGVLLLIAACFLGWTDSNALLVSCLLLIGAGIALHVLMLKRASRY